MILSFGIGTPAGWCRENELAAKFPAAFVDLPRGARQGPDRQLRNQKRGGRGGALRPAPAAPGITRGFIGNSPSRCSFLRASLRARRTASAFCRTRFSE